MLTKQKEDFSKWYNQVVLKADLAEYSPVKGCMIIKPYGYAIWENIQKALDDQIKNLDIKNVYFPLFIPEGYLKKEAEHIEGFAPEVAWVTHGGNKKLPEKLALRPTSETVIYDVFRKWIKSYRDLPLKINQWANIVRWEMRTRLFLRTREFLWQEGHTAHKSKTEADWQTEKMLEVYHKTIKNWFGIYSISGSKTESEKFAGALYTLSVESLMKDSKALQMGTSHNLGQNFAKAFDIKYLDKNGKRKFVWQTSWGVSTRRIGALIMAHGDDNGLIIPPKLAPIQIIIVPIWTNSKEKVKIKHYINKIEEELKQKNIRFKTDWRGEQTPGWKFNDWELKGVPLRLEIGPKEASQNKITYALRDNFKKIQISFKEFFDLSDIILSGIQSRLLNKSKKFTQDNTYKTNSFSQFKEIIENKGGFIKAGWCGNANCEEKIQKETKATIRCIPSKQVAVKNKKCIKCGKKAKFEVMLAKSY